MVQTHSNTATVEPTCTTCQERLPLVPYVKVDRAPEVAINYDVVATFPGLCRERVPGLHTAVLSGVLLRYRLPRLIQCNYGHRHKVGFVIDTLCGARLLIGYTCASHAVVNFDALDAELIRLDTFAHNRATIARAGEIGVRVAVTVLDAEALIDAGTRLRNSEHFFGLGERLLARRNSEVSYEVKGKEYYTSLVGLELFDASRNTTELRTDMRETMTAIRREEPLGDEAAADIAKRLRGIESKITQLETWAGLSRRFFDQGNLVLAVLASGLDKQLRVDGRRLTRTDGNETWSIGEDGKMKPRSNR